MFNIKMLNKISFPSVLKDLHDLLSVLWIRIRSYRVLDMVPDPVPDMVSDTVPDLFLGDRALQNDAIRKSDLTKVAIANSE
jgi:hypothetical protein